MSNSESSPIRYSWYPSKDKDTDRNKTREDLKFENGVWSHLAGPKLSDEKLKDIKANVESERGEIFKYLTETHREDAYRDLMGYERRNYIKRS